MEKEWSRMGKFLINLRKMCSDVGLIFKQKFPSSPSLHATEARNASALWKFVMIIAQVNLYAVTPD